MGLAIFFFFITFCVFSAIGTCKSDFYRKQAKQNGSIFYFDDENKMRDTKTGKRCGLIVEDDKNKTVDAHLRVLSVEYKKKR